MGHTENARGEGAKRGMAEVQAERRVVMIENSFVTVKSDGKRVTVEYLEDGELREGPAIFPARYSSFAAICQYINTQFNGHDLDLSASVEIQGLLGSPWPARHLRFEWASMPPKRKIAKGGE